MKIAGLILVFLCAFVVVVAAEEPPKSDELTVLRLRVLSLERENVALASRLAIVEKTQAIDKGLAEAAKAAGVNLADGWALDLQTRAWVKK